MASEEVGHHRRHSVAICGGDLGLVEAEHVEASSQTQAVEMPAQPRRLEMDVFDGRRSEDRLAGGERVVLGERGGDAQVVGMAEAVAHRRLDPVGVALGQLIDQCPAQGERSVMRLERCDTAEVACQ